MASKDSATRTKTNAKPIKGLDGAHHGARDVFRAMSEEQHAALMGAIRDPGGDPDSLFDAARAQIAEKRDLTALQDKGLDAYMTEWRALAPAQQKKEAARLGPLREKVKALPPFENRSLEVERQDPYHLAATLCRREADFQGEEVPVELHTLERLLSPAAQAWEQAAHHVNQALADEHLKRHPVVKAIFDKLASAIMDHTWDDLATPENVLRFMLDQLALDEVRKSDTARAAKLKNAGPIEWTQSMWNLVKVLKGDIKDIPSALESSLKDGSIPRANYTDAELRDFINQLEIERNKPENEGRAMDRKFFSHWVWVWLKKHGFRAWSNKRKGDEVKEVKIGPDQIYKEWLKGL